ncbi:hypothetical protein HPT27_06915 [Permianibacter sp. IMCC34836]|uniref:glycoside hydrolase family 26 protein n=1 Tax=Permianibacter fluminis TaxID=2738515 RepID=UPI00155370C8|nr:glycosyl hydrolase [Permianibacter fluminis]NQD36752.1 hypothetical protein [Permianibacter fluminis]
MKLLPNAVCDWRLLASIGLLLTAAVPTLAATPPPIEPPIDNAATAETRQLHSKLIALADADGFAFGNQGDYHSGVGWDDLPDDIIRPSDIYQVLNVHAGVSGYNANWLFDKDNKANYAAFDEIGKEMQIASHRGALITLHWPMDNPVAPADDRNCTDCSHLIDSVLEHKVYDPDNRGEQGENYLLWTQWMDVLAEFIKTRAVDGGKAIPILFRPWHEMNQGEDGVGRWYQVANNSREEYLALWQQTVSYLRDKKGIHNLLYVYAPSLNAIACEGCKPSEKYLENYPGNDWVDVMAGDCYAEGIADSQARFAHLTQGIQIIADTARTNGKIPALSETGYKDGLQHDVGNNFWYSQWLLGVSGAVPAKLKRMAYVMSWSNSGDAAEPKFFVPYPKPTKEHDEIADFRAFHASHMPLFAGDLRAMFDGAK